MIGPSTVEAGHFPTKPLGEVVTFLDHKRRPITAKDRTPGPIPYYGANGQQDSVADWLFDEPLVLLAEDGGHFDDPNRGIAYRIEGRSWVNNHAHVLRAGPNLDTQWLARVLENYDVTKFLTGSTRAKLTKSGAARIPVPLPPIEDQRRIAAVLGAADALRAKRRQAVAKLDTLTQAIFIDMFGDPRSNCHDLPTQSLQELSDGIYDCPHSTPRWTNEGLICLRTPNLGHGVWDWSDTRYVSLETFETRSKRAELEPGDIVLSREGTVGIAALVQPGMRMCMGQRLVQVRPGDEVRPRFLLSVLLFLLDPERIARVMAGSTAKHLNVKELRLLQVVVPPLKDQDRFVKAVEKQSLAATMLLTSERQLDDLFGWLQQRAFRGEL